MHPMPIELILMRQWAMNLATPVILVDRDDRVAFVNDTALDLIRQDRDKVAGRTTRWLAGKLAVRDASSGLPLQATQLEVTALARSLGPRHIQLRYQPPGGVSRRIDLTALPLEGQGERCQDEHGDDAGRPGMMIGAALLFWEVESS